MKKIAILSMLMLTITSTSSAQDSCITRPSCADMGYTKTEADCTGKTTLKCPFDLTKVSCVGGGSGTDGADGGDDTSSPTCNIGDIYYDDDTCSSIFDVQKNAIGIVFDTTRRYIVSLSHGIKKWAEYNISSDITIPKLTKTDVALARDFNGKAYTEQLVASSSSYPAAEYCARLNTGGKEWFLPSGGQMYLLAQQRTKVNTGLNKVNVGTVHTLGYEVHYTAEEIIGAEYDMELYYYYYWTSNLGSSGFAIDYNMEPGDTGFAQYYVNEHSLQYVNGMTEYITYYLTRCIAEY